MKINNNISIYQQNTNLNKKNNSVRRLSTPQMANDTVSFTGIPRFLKPSKLNRMDNWLKSVLEYTPGMIDRSKEEVEAALQHKSVSQKRFFAELVDNYNRNNFGRPAEKKEDADIIFKMIDKVKHPTEAHLDMARSSHLNVTEAFEIMEKLDYDSSKISKFHPVYRNLIQSNYQYGVTNRSIINILDTKNSEKIINDYPTYKPYLKMHIAEENGLKNLDEQISNGTYDAVKEQNLLSLKNRMISSRVISETVDVDRMVPHSSKESNSILDLVFDKLNPISVKDRTNYRENLVDIYSTTTKDNVEARTAYLNTYMLGHGIEDYRPDEMDNISKLFKMMDEDPKVMKFVKDISVPNSNITGADGFIKIIDNVDPKRRELYAPNVAYIMSQGVKNPVEKAIRFCNILPDNKSDNIVRGVKSYVSGLFSKKASSEGKIQRRQFNRMYKQLDIPKNETLAGKEAQAAAVSESVSRAVTPNVPAVIYRFPKLDISKPAYTTPVLPKLADIVGGNNRLKFNIPVPVVTKPADAVVEAAKTEPKVIKKGIFVNRTAKQPSAQKLQIISDVNNLIEKKLGKNTLADQSRTYERSATKMRLSMLPEIFESIKETRAQKRAAGTFSKHKSESNADALTLYNMINGKNKKLVNYMLKVRDENGSRIYSVKDIIATVGEKEKAIRTAKLQGTPIPSAEAKSIYTNMLDEQIAQHGKLPRAKKK